MARPLPAESGWYLRDLESYGRLGSGFNHANGQSRNVVIVPASAINWALFFATVSGCEGLGNQIMTCSGGPVHPESVVCD